MIQYQNLCMSTRLLDPQLSHLAFTFVRVCVCVPLRLGAICMGSQPIQL